MKKRKGKRGKRAISLMVSYVLLIVIALTLAGGVYTWLRFYIPQTDQQQECPTDTSLTIRSYTCPVGPPKDIILNIENNGFFNVDGFFLRVANESGKLPTLLLTNPTGSVGSGLFEGRYYLGTNILAPGKNRTFPIVYTDANQVYRVQVQPFIQTETDLLSCKTSVDLYVEVGDCDTT